MAEVITMPKMSDTMTEGVIVAWHKKPGDKVSSGDLLAEIETDKATMDLESYQDGILLYIGVKKGETVVVDGILAIIGEKGEDYKQLLAAEQSKLKKQQQEIETVKTGQLAEASAQAGLPAEASAQAGSPVNEIQAPPKAEIGLSQNVSPQPGLPQKQIGQTNDRALKASPLAKKLAKEKGYDLSLIRGTGDDGRITKRDIEEFVPAAGSNLPAGASAQAGALSFTIPEVVGQESYEEVANTQMRKTVARRLSESKYTSPHYYLTMEIVMDKAMEARKSINEISPLKISFNDIIIKAVAAAIRQNPKVNASWIEDANGETKVRYNKHIHIGVAVAVDDGLVVPVIRFADNKSLAHIAAEVKQLADKAKNKALQPPDYEGNTFTISNLGMFGIEEFTAIINPPDACILAVGGIKQVPLVKDGEIKPGNTMKITLSCDHRVVDGATGSQFLQTLKSLLEDPVKILV
ncbi:MAG: pyruvate dehydrogenase complex dihydrolipoamide acetyltransferase [Bacteroidetes bacterium]|nr:pyruvate dehydrogenase complex dihydrolipoamide acetyltransferase [Bacteroidota bacterium]